MGNKATLKYAKIIPSRSLFWCDEMLFFLFDGEKCDSWRKKRSHIVRTSTSSFFKLNYLRHQRKVFSTTTPPPLCFEVSQREVLSTMSSTRPVFFVAVVANLAPDPTSGNKRIEEEWRKALGDGGGGVLYV